MQCSSGLETPICQGALEFAIKMYYSCTVVCTDFLTRCCRLISISDRDINYLHVY